ncbi:MAG: hypothetical protein K1060chlam3_00206 [Candidatus Anoxychlamydiales bacterium]|nr:hypothetical protein [Candidatus Anoxychlamydiales bacterium]
MTALTPSQSNSPFLPTNPASPMPNAQSPSNGPPSIYSNTTKAESSSPPPKLSRVSLNGKQYQIIIKRPGSNNTDLAPGVSQKFATLFGTTLKYGLAALCHQHNLKENDIKLKYVKIKKKLDGDLFLTYKDKDKNNKYKIKITNDLKIKGSDKDIVETQIAEEKPKDVNTAYKTFEKAIETFDTTATGGDATNNSIIGLYELTIDANCLSTSVKESYDPKNKIPSKPLRSNSNASQEKHSTTPGVAGEEKLEKKEDAVMDSSSKKEDAVIDSSSKSLESGTPDPSSSSSPSSPPVLPASSSSSSSSSPVASPTATRPSEEANPLKVSEEEKDFLKIPFSTTDSSKNPTWKEYLLKGTLGGEGTLPPDRKHIERTVKPTTFTKDEAKAIVIKIIKNESSNELTPKENVFLKRFLLQLLADKLSEKVKVSQENRIKTLLNWTITEFGWEFDATVLLDNNDQKVKIAIKLKTSQEVIAKQLKTIEK